MALTERAFEELSIEELSLWLKGKGFSSEVQEAFERKCVAYSESDAFKL